MTPCIVIPDRIDCPTQPTGEVVALDDAKAHARVTSSAEDALSRKWIAAAARRVQERTDRQLLTATFKAYLPGFPVGGEIELRPAPLAGITKLTYLDEAGTPVEILEADLGAAGILVVKPVGDQAEAGRLVLEDGQEWPTTSPHPEAVVIEFTAGYGATAAAIPGQLAEAVKEGYAELFNYREKPDLDTAIDPHIQDFILWR